jgi:hypothetical protein
MAQRKWFACWNFGCAGTDHREEVDLVDTLGENESDVEGMTDEEAADIVADYANEQASERISAWGERKEVTPS